MRKLAEQLARLQQLIGDLQYETAPGTHTFSGCECGRAPGRRRFCRCCILDAMDVVIRQMKATDERCRKRRAARAARGD